MSDDFNILFEEWQKIRQVQDTILENLEADKQARELAKKASRGKIIVYIVLVVAFLLVGYQASNVKYFTPETEIGCHLSGGKTQKTQDSHFCYFYIEN